MVIKLLEQSVINRVVSTYEELLQLMENSNRIEIDCSQVRYIDTPFLQMLAIVKRELPKRHGGVRIVNPSQEFQSASQLLGMDKYLSE